VKFEFIPEEEWDTLPEPDPHQAQEREQVGEKKQPLPPGALIATASERMHSQAHTDFSRLRISLNRMLHTVEAARPQAESSFTESDPEPGVDVFRPQAFRSHPLPEKQHARGCARRTEHRAQPRTGPLTSGRDAPDPGLSPAGGW
jgi:hypothetical protein